MAFKRPLFIVFEGIDGSGKSTACRDVAGKLTEVGEPVITLAEPTGGQHGRKIRELLSGPIKPDPDVMLELFIKDREDDAAVNIKPALDNGSIVLMDRYYYSNAAYQGASGLSWKRILKLNESYGFPKPDKVYFIDVDPEAALERIRLRNEENGSSSDLFEKKQFLEEVRSIYNLISESSIVRIDGSMTKEKTVEFILDDMRRSFSNVE